MKKTQVIPRSARLLAILLLVVFGGVILHAPLSVGLGSIFPQAELYGKAWKELILVIATVVAAVLLTRQKQWSLLRDKVIYCIAGFAAVHILSVVLFFQGVNASVAGLMIDLRFLLFFVLVFVLLKLYPTYRKPFLWVGIVGALIVGGFAILQVTVLPHDVLSILGYSKATIAPYLTVDQNYDFIRINSTLRGPNPLGAYAGIVLALVAAALCHRVVPKHRRAYAIVAIITLGAVVSLWASYSRSALVAAVVAIGLVLAATLLRKISRRMWIIGVIVCFGLAGALAANWNSTFVSQVLLHENPNGGSVVSSNDDHASSLQTGLERLVAQPFGAGVGSTGSASLHGDAPIIIENQYLLVAHEAGWLGLGLFLLLIGLVSLRLWRARADWLALGVFASGVGLALIGLLLPVWVDETVAIIWWGLAAVALSTGRPSKVIPHTLY